MQSTYRHTQRLEVIQRYALKPIQKEYICTIYRMLVQSLWAAVVSGYQICIFIARFEFFLSSLFGFFLFIFLLRFYFFKCTKQH